MRGESSCCFTEEEKKAQHASLLLLLPTAWLPDRHQASTGGGHASALRPEVTLWRKGLSLQWARLGCVLSYGLPLYAGRAYSGAYKEQKNYGATCRRQYCPA